MLDPVFSARQCSSWYTDIDRREERVLKNQCSCFCCCMKIRKKLGQISMAPQIFRLRHPEDCGQSSLSDIGASAQYSKVRKVTSWRNYPALTLKGSLSLRFLFNSSSLSSLKTVYPFTTPLLHAPWQTKKVFDLIMA